MGNMDKGKLCLSSVSGCKLVELFIIGCRELNQGTLNPASIYLPFIFASPPSTPSTCPVIQL